MRVVLEVTESANPDLVGKRFVIDKPASFVMGRPSNKNKIRSVQFKIPADPHFSRIHMLIEATPDQCLVRDLNSRNGTKVNGHTLDAPAMLKDGDILEGGRTAMRVRIESSVPAREVEPPIPASAPPPAPSLNTPSRPAFDLERTQVLSSSPRLRPGEVRCFVCGEVHSDTLVGDLADTSLVAYVCQGCRDKHDDRQFPIPNYERLGKLGDGSLGPVYKARRLPGGKLVALKILSPEMASNPDAVKLFLRQIRLTSSLKHPNIVPIVEIGQAGKQLWLATAYVDGVDARCLRQRLDGKFPLADAVDIVCQTLEALDYAHKCKNNLVHRDVKPSNILVTGSSGSYTAQLGDFGLVKNMDEAGLSDVTRGGEIRGTVPFMPPEQVLDSRFVRPQGDIYGAGATLYWLLTGEYVLDFESLDERTSEKKNPYVVILDDPIIPLRQRNAAIPEAIAQVVEKALAKDPEDRFCTAKAMIGDLKKALASVSRQSGERC